jgi:hypothetical protein
MHSCAVHNCTGSGLLCVMCVLLRSPAKTPFGRGHSEVFGCAAAKPSSSSGAQCTVGASQGQNNLFPMSIHRKEAPILRQLVIFH